LRTPQRSMRRCLHSLQSTELLYLVQDRWCRFPGVSRFHLGSIRPLWFGRQRPAPVVRRTRLLSVASCRSCPEERKERPPVSLWCGGLIWEAATPAGYRVARPYKNRGFSQTSTSSPNTSLLGNVALCSIATGRGKLQIQPCPQCPVSDGRPEKGGLSLRAMSCREQVQQQSRI
jgi:hypothetical protein